MAVYLDNSATTKPSQEVIAAMVYALEHAYGNPSSLHEKGIEAEALLEEARQQVAKQLSVKNAEVYFTTSGTQANNIALLGSIKKQKHFGKKILTSAVEHPSVSETMNFLAGEGFEIVYIPITQGKLDLAVLEKEATPDVVLASFMAVNNETGTCFPITEIASLIHKKCPHGIVHCDAVQAFGKIDMQPITAVCDLVTVSSHKIHGPKGAGALYIKEGVKIASSIYGGGQEKNIVSGTQAIPAIVGFATAAKDIPNVKKTLPKMQQMYHQLKENLLQIDGVVINSPEDALPYILNVSVLGLKSETMLNFLSDMGIYVSNGSACTKGKHSRVLEAFGVAGEYIDSALRISLSVTTTLEELEALTEGIRQCKKVLYGIL